VAEKVVRSWPDRPDGLDHIVGIDSSSCFPFTERGYADTYTHQSQTQPITLPTTWSPQVVGNKHAIRCEINLLPCSALVEQASVYRINHARFHSCAWWIAIFSRIHRACARLISLLLPHSNTLSFLRTTAYML